jgi:PEP-CTERM motif-containing protein
VNNLVVTAVAAAGIALFGPSSAAEAAMINFTVTAIDGTPTYTGTSLNDATAVDVDKATLSVTEVDGDDNSGLSPRDIVTLDPGNIAFGTGPGTPPGFSEILSWTGDNNDVFTETLATVDSIDQTTPNQAIVYLSGTVSDSFGHFVNTPIVFVLNATEFGGVGTPTTVTFTNSTTATPAIPEPSTWVMMTVGFGALGYAAFRRRAA